MTAMKSSRAVVLAAAIGCGLLGFAIPLTSAEPSKPAATAPAATVKAGPKDPRQSTLDFLKAYEPEVLAWLGVLQSKDPKRYNEVMGNMVCEVNSLMDLKKRDPDRFPVTMQDRKYAFEALQLAAIIRNESSSVEDVQVAKTKLKATLTAQFAVRQQLRQMQLDFLQKQLDGLRQELNNREQSKDSLIEKRMEDLIKRNARGEW